MSLPTSNPADWDTLTARTLEHLAPQPDVAEPLWYRGSETIKHLKFKIYHFFRRSPRDHFGLHRYRWRDLIGIAYFLLATFCWSTAADPDPSPCLAHLTVTILNEDSEFVAGDRLVWVQKIRLSGISPERALHFEDGHLQAEKIPFRVGGDFQLSFAFEGPHSFMRNVNAPPRSRRESSRR